MLHVCSCWDSHGDLRQHTVCADLFGIRTSTSCCTNILSCEVGTGCGSKQTMIVSLCPFHPIPLHVPKEHSFVYSFLVMFRSEYMYIHKDTHAPQACPYTLLKHTRRRTPHTVLHLAFISQQYGKHVSHQHT